MTFKEFKEKIKEWGEKYNYKTVVYDYDDHIKITVEDEDFIHMICTVHKTETFVMDVMWMAYRLLSENEKSDLFKIVTEFSVTKIEDREDEKVFIIPLPSLVTTDGRQQYLTKKGCRFFASRRRREKTSALRQTWKEEDLKSVPKFYRQFAVEFNEEKEHEDDI